jgi:tRNA(Arg) A34 adenosine deaminase TadA
MKSDRYTYDKHYMQYALEEARAAGERGEVPIGALIVSSQGQILGRDGNRVEEFSSQTRHAELGALEAAGKYLKDWRIAGATIYITLEPCMMCVSGIALSRIERIVYGAASPLFGYTLDKEGVLQVYTKHIKNITSGICADEAAELLREFFRRERKSGEKHGS